MRLIDADALDFGFAMTDDMNGMLKQIGIEMANCWRQERPSAREWSGRQYTETSGRMNWCGGCARRYCCCWTEKSRRNNGG